MSRADREPPIACSLPRAALADRRAAWERLGERALRDRRPTAGGMRLTYAAVGETEAELRELAALEGECCPFADWRVTVENEQVVLEVTASGDGVAAVRALFAGSGAASAG
jgi:hypothetical protein